MGSDGEMRFAFATGCLFDGIALGSEIASDDDEAFLRIRWKVFRPMSCRSLLHDLNVFVGARLRLSTKQEVDLSCAVRSSNGKLGTDREIHYDTKASTMRVTFSVAATCVPAMEGAG